MSSVSQGVPHQAPNRGSRLLQGLCRIDCVPVSVRRALFQELSVPPAYKLLGLGPARLTAVGIASHSLSNRN
jgi:hypothetical protein